MRNSDTVAWLRVIEDPVRRWVFGGLLETSLQDGQPRAFVFSGSRLPIGPDSPDGPISRSIRRKLAGMLLRENSGMPALVLARNDELTSVDIGEVTLPLCSVQMSEIGPNQFFEGEQPSVSWHTLPADHADSARQMLEEIVLRDDPFEPFERVTKGLDEAFAENKVRAMWGIRGLMTLATLYAPPPPEAERENGSEADEGRQDSELDFARRLWAVLAAPNKPEIFTVEHDLEWPAPLMRYQQDGVSALVSMERLLLADDMGLGKTIQTLAALRILHARREIRSALIIGPVGVLDQWRRELEKWAPELSAIIIRGSAEERAWQWRTDKNVIIASYDVIRTDRIPIPIGQSGFWDVVVLDEAQRIKNRNDTSEAAKRIPRIRSWALTGTPIENSEDELASIMEFVDHGIGPVPLRYQPGPELRFRHRELQIRRKKSDVLDDLPEKLETRLTIPLDPAQRASYDKAERDGIVYLRSLGTDATVSHVLELVTRLKQICNVDPETGASSKLEDIRERLFELTAQNHKALIFSQYVSEDTGVGAAAKFLKEFNPLVLTGDVPQVDRQDLIDRFKNSPDHHAMVISLRAGGLGLNLQEASYVFHLDRWWNPAVERQAEDRSHRMGQTVKVNVIKYTCENTIEERIERILAEKRDIFRDLVDDVSLDLSTNLDRDDLMNLFGLR